MKLNTTQCSKLFFGNHCFYHVTPTDNIPGILESGLKIGNQQGICTVIVDDPLITKYIIESQLRDQGKEDFTVLSIRPNDHPLFFGNLMLDGSPMLSNPLHMYFKKEPLFLTNENIIREIHVPLAETTDLTAVAERVETVFNDLTKELSTKS